MFSPTEEEVAWARKIIAAFEEPENKGKGVIVVEGRMVERLQPRWRAARWPSPMPSSG